MMDEEGEPSCSSNGSLASRGRNRCAHCCANRITHPKRRFFRFPKDPVLSKKWVDACKRPLLEEKSPLQLYASYRVCSEHFQPCDFAGPSMYKLSQLACPVVRSDAGAEKAVVLKPKVMSEMLCHKLSSHEVEEEPHDPENSVAAAFSDDISSLGSLQFEMSGETSIVTPLDPPMTSTPKRKRISKTTRVITPKTRKIKILSSKLYHMKNKRKIPERVQLGHILAGIKSYVPKVVYNFITAQLKSFSVSPYGRRWSKENKELALKLYLSSPRAYNTLRKYFCFPTKKTVLKTISAISVQSGFSEAVLRALKSISTKMKKEDKFCIISFDEVKLQKGLTYSRKLDQIIGFENYGEYRELNSNLATHALAFMVRGMCRKWKQVFGSFFASNSTSSDVLKDLVIEAIRKIRDCGLLPIAVVCDQGASNVKLFYTELGITEDRPYFEVDGHKVFSIFDPPHLLKNLRNNMKKYVVQFEGGKKAYWQHIVGLYEFDSKQDHRVVPKLSSQHVYVNGLQSMNVSLAAQVFSRSVSSGLCYLSVFDYLPGANVTADFCEKINDLFDSVNGRMMCHKTPLLSACTQKSQHIEHWNKAIDFIKSIEFLTGEKKIRFHCLSGWIITLSAFQMLVKELLQSVSFILMSRFNQDALENFFAQVRRKGGNNDHPRALDFLYRMRMLLAQDLIRTCEHANCQADEDAVLIPIDVLSSFSATEDMLGPDSSLIIDDFVFNSIPEETLTHLGNSMERNSAAYVAGFLASKALKKYSCVICKRNLKSEEKVLSDSTVFLHMKEYNAASAKGLCHPTELCITAVVQFGHAFVHLFKECCHKPGIIKYIVQELLLHDNEWLECEEHKQSVWEYIVHFYVKLMVYYKVKAICNDIKNVKKAKKKLKKLS